MLLSADRPDARTFTFTIHCRGDVSMALVDFFLKIDGIEGESQDACHKAEIELLSMQAGGSKNFSITVAKKIDKLKYDPAIGSFKGWLLQITRWRIVDQFRKRQPGDAKRPRDMDDRMTATIERIPDSRVVDLDEVWEVEWKENLFEAAIARAKKKVDPKQFQIFDCYVRKEWPAQKVAEQLKVSVGQVYLARHRVAAVLKKEIKALEKAGC